MVHEGLVGKGTNAVTAGFPRLGALRLVETTRAEFDDAVTAVDLEQLADRPAVRTLQRSAPVPDSIWPLLNDAFFSRRPDVELRVYGHYSTDCDLSFARRMTNVRRFAADCLVQATNVDALAEMPQLDALSLGIYELRDFGVLERVPSTLTTLSLAATRSNGPRLDVLRRFTSLKTLYLGGQIDGIEVLGELGTLEDVTLGCLPTPDLSYLAALTRLRSLDIKLGAVRSFEGIEGRASLEHLALWQIPELDIAAMLRSLPGLQSVFLQSLAWMRGLPDLRACGALRRVVLHSMKGLRDFSAVEGAPVLEEFALVQGRWQQPEQLMPVLRSRTIGRVHASFGAAHHDREFMRLRDAHHMHDWDPSTPFRYRESRR
jgi:hypothetical protein